MAYTPTDFADPLQQFIKAMMLGGKETYPPNPNWYGTAEYGEVFDAADRANAADSSSAAGAVWLDNDLDDPTSDRYDGFQDDAQRMYEKMSNPQSDAMRRYIEWMNQR